MKRLITGLSLIALMLGIMILDYYFIYGSMSIYSATQPHIPIFSDIFVWLLASISIFELYKCYSQSGYNLFKAPLILLAVAIYPVYFLMQYFLGLGIEALHILNNVEGIGIVNLDRGDIVRHKLVTRIVNAYEQFDKEMKE